MRASTLRAEIEQELRGNLLPFWRERSLDPGGGFIAEMGHDGTVRREAPKGLILNARLLWTFSALYRRLADPHDLELAERAREYLETRFRDPEHGGYFWRLDSLGRPLEREKKTYGQAFCVYALSEHALATGSEESLAAARRAWERIERHARDGRNGGYLEALAADWSPAAEQRLSEKDLVAAKSMNTHLHLVEAYANLYRTWPDDTVAERLRELIDLFGRHILDRSGGPGSRHLRAFFDERWVALSDGYTYGHDIEAAWLLGEAAEALGDSELRATVDGWAADIAGATLAEGLDRDGALAYAGRDGAVTDPRREWWCQAEAVVGFWHAYEVTREMPFAQAAARAWRFIAGKMVDRVNGEWFWRVRADGSVDESEPKVSEWKGPYHTVRMCLEMTRRIGRPANGRAP